MLLVVSDELGGLEGDLLEDVVDEGVHDGHSLLRDTSIRVHLLEHLVDVRGIRLDALLVLLATGCLLGCLLFTSDAADVLLCVYLCGRMIIKK